MFTGKTPKPRVECEEQVKGLRGELQEQRATAAEAASCRCRFGPLGRCVRLKASQILSLGPRKGLLLDAESLVITMVISLLSGLQPGYVTTY